MVPGCGDGLQEIRWSRSSGGPGVQRLQCHFRLRYLHRMALRSAAIKVFFAVHAGDAGRPRLPPQSTTSTSSEGGLHAPAATRQGDAGWARLRRGWWPDRATSRGRTWRHAVAEDVRWGRKFGLPVNVGTAKHPGIPFCRPNGRSSWCRWLTPATAGHKRRYEPFCSARRKSAKFSDLG